MIRTAGVIVALAAFVLSVAPSPVRAEVDGKKKIVLVAGRPSHGYGAHEHNAGMTLLKERLEKSGLPVTVELVKNGWPSDESVFNGADAIVMYMDGGGGHPGIKHLDKLNELMGKGIGFMCMHYAVEVPKGDAGEAWKKWIGGYYETHFSINPHWSAKVSLKKGHAITNGVEPFEVHDEWYYNMRFREGKDGVVDILTAVPDDEARSGSTASPRGPKPHIVEAKGRAETLMWAVERPDGGRGVGFTGGHFHWNWGHPGQMKLALNAIVWISGLDVPKEGVKFDPPTADELINGQDEQVDERRFNREKLEKDLEQWQGKKSASSQPTSKATAKGKAKPLYDSGVINESTPGLAKTVDIDIKGVKTLYLVVNDGGDGYGADWADWAEPRLVGPSGEKKLTEMKWKSAEAGWGNVGINKNARGETMRIAGKNIPYGIGTHANSTIVYDLGDHNFERFKATVGIDNGGSDQGLESSVRFFVFDQPPPATIAAPVQSEQPIHDPANAVEALEVADGLDAQLFAAEPMINSVSNIDVDHLGRVWVAEIVNYRRFNGRRPEGDRILILEDTNGDGAADKETVFYQGRDIDSPHGVCVLGTPDGKNTRVIVSSGDNVWLFTDVDGDGKADDKKAMFTGIGGAQHDHGIHAFVFGPDGKLYFNFGNSGRDLKDASGKPVTDAAGNRPVPDRKPYQEGMVFRCDLDGSNLETLGWNFRNNWMATLDSFGTIWQSDNDDDGNKGVRINYVMEYGNYGYKDEKTGANWRAKRTGMGELPGQHWHLNDPGVVPNLLHTGAGSPTGITVYEGTLLPEVFRGQIIHCDAGPNTCRAYPVKPSGAGYNATIEPVLWSTRDKWYRPSDVSVAPDGSLMVADWYDPGVGGHNAQDLGSGRIFRIAPEGATAYSTPKFDFSTPAGAVEALKSPNYAARYVAWQALHGMGDKAKPAIETMAGDSNPRYRARAIWLLASLDAGDAVNRCLGDKSPDIRGMAVRIARQHESVDTLGVIEKLVDDKSAAVRRECAIGLRFAKGDKAAKLWAKLAAQHDGEDRWYLEALGIGSDLHADECFAAWLGVVGDKWNTPAGRDIIWRVRSKQAPAYLAKIITDPNTAKDEQPRYYRSLDFHDGPEKDAALNAILGL